MANGSSQRTSLSAFNVRIFRAQKNKTEFNFFQLHFHNKSLAYRVAKRRSWSRKCIQNPVHSLIPGIVACPSLRQTSLWPLNWIVKPRREQTATKDRRNVENSIFIYSMAAIEIAFALHRRPNKLYLAFSCNFLREMFVECELCYAQFLGVSRARAFDVILFLFLDNPPFSRETHLFAFLLVDRGKEKIKKHLEWLLLVLFKMFFFFFAMQKHERNECRFGCTSIQYAEPIYQKSLKSQLKSSCTRLKHIRMSWWKIYETKTHTTVSAKLDSNK